MQLQHVRRVEDAPPASTPSSNEVRSPSPTVLPPLSGTQVLVDTYNLRLPQGSGIKTYGLTLVRALSALGMQVNLLSDRAVRSTSVKALRQVLLFDAREVPERARTPARQALRAARRILGAERPLEVRLDQVVPDTQRFAGADLSHRAFNLPGCYDDANRIFMRLRAPTRLRVPESLAVWHATCPIPIAVPGVKQITTIHDLIPLRLPHTTLDDKVFFHRTVRDAIRRSALILTVSEHTRRDVLEYFDVDPDKIVVTHQPPLVIQDEVTPSHARLVLSKHRLQPRRYILAVGNIEPKKNMGRLIEAFAGIDTDLSLVVVGRKAWMWEQEVGRAEALLGKKRCTQRFRLLDYVPREDLEVLYSQAAFMVFPSLYEGFGLPPLEAMHFGCPVIVSNTSSLPEVCGDAAAYVDPYDVRDIRTKMIRLIESDVLRESLSVKGVERARMFSMESYQRRLLEAYRRVL